MIYRKLVEVIALDNFRVFVKFDDGKSGEINFANDVEIGVFSKLKEKDNFFKTKIDPYGSSFFWDINVPDIEKPDSSAEWLYMQLDIN